MRTIFLTILGLAVPIAKGSSILELPMTFDGQSYTVNIDFYNLTSEFMMGSRNFSVSLIPLFGVDYTAVADDTCEDCKIKGYNATLSHMDGYLTNSTKNGLSREGKLSFFKNGYTLWGAPVRDTVCVPMWIDNEYNQCFSKDQSNHLDFLLFNDYLPTRNSISTFPADAVIGLSPRLGSGYSTFVEHLKQLKLIPSESVNSRDF